MSHKSRRRCPLFKISNIIITFNYLRIQKIIYDRLFQPFCLPPICWFQHFNRLSTVSIFYHFLLKKVNSFRFSSSAFNFSKRFFVRRLPNKDHFLIWKVLFFVKFQVNSSFLVAELCRVLQLRDLTKSSEKKKKTYVDFNQYLGTG